PLQHASDRILRAMRRWGNRRAYETLLSRVREAMPDVALRTTFIVGFPGEQESDLQALLNFMEAVEFDHVGVFAYAREEGTPSATMDEQVPPRERRRRAFHDLSVAVHVAFLAGAVYPAVRGWAPPLLPLALVPPLVWAVVCAWRARWRGATRLDRVGWSEVYLTVLFAALTVLALRLPA
ncbi:MAG: hypothetical protein LOD90_07225, partial [Symbiobacteriaceae bacterium]